MLLNCDSEASRPGARFLWRANSFERTNLHWVRVQLKMEFSLHHRKYIQLLGSNYIWAEAE